MIEISWITEQIGISRVFPNSELPYLKDEGVKAVIDVRSEYSDNKELLEKHEMKFLHVEVDDTYTPNFEQLERIFNFVEPLLNDKKQILIHCHNAYGRAPLVVVAILAKRGMGIPEAVSLVEDKHPHTNFSNRQQIFIYMDLQEFLKGESLE